MITRKKIITIEAVLSDHGVYLPRVQVHLAEQILRPDLTKTFWDALHAKIKHIADYEAQRHVF